jgi:hypothetical protein
VVGFLPLWTTHTGQLLTLHVVFAIKLPILHFLMLRGLHYGWFYRYIHKDHHAYVDIMSPFASHAFHPLDGWSQVCVCFVCFLAVNSWTVPCARELELVYLSVRVSNGLLLLSMIRACVGAGVWSGRFEGFHAVEVSRINYGCKNCWGQRSELPTLKKKSGSDSTRTRTPTLASQSCQYSANRSLRCCPVKFAEKLTRKKKFNKLPYP